LQYDQTLNQNTSVTNKTDRRRDNASCHRRLYHSCSASKSDRRRVVSAVCAFGGSL